MALPENVVGWLGTVVVCKGRNAVAEAAEFLWKISSAFSASRRLK